MRVVSENPLAPLALVAALLLLPATASHAQDFYKGKTIRIIVGFGAGSGFDFYSRLLAEYMSQFIPGEPATNVEYMTGAGSVNAANYVYNVAPKDGTVIAIVDQTAPMHQLIGGSGAQFTSSELQWLGSAAHSNGLIDTWYTSGIQTIEDAEKTTVKIGAVAKTADSYIFPAISNNILGTKFQTILGYPDGGQTDLAMERGEVAGNGASSWFGLQTRHRDWINDKKIHLLVQIGVAKERDLPDVPLLGDLTKDVEGRQISDLLSVSTSIGYAYWVAPGVPADRIAILRAAFDKALQDPPALADTKKQGLELRPQSGADISAQVKKISDTPQNVLDRMANILGVRE